jgi:hypothetical protein
MFLQVALKIFKDESKRRSTWQLHLLFVNFYTKTMQAYFRVVVPAHSVQALPGAEEPVIRSSGKLT